MKKLCIGPHRNLVTQTDHTVWLHFVHDAVELLAYLNAGVQCYKDVFAGPPYFENYDGQEKTFIEPMFANFATKGILVFVLTGETSDAEIVGFAASHSAEDSEVKDFLLERASELEVHPRNYLYMAEVAVREGYRKQGLGTRLVKIRIEESHRKFPGRFTHVLMRTAAEDSNSAGIYRKMGAKNVPGLIQNKNDFGTLSTSRIFLSMPA